MRARLSLLAAELHYEPDIQVFTAISGPTPHLAARYLLLERSDGVRGFSEIRANISFLSHIAEQDVAGVIRRLAGKLDWSADPTDLLLRLDAIGADHAPIARAAVESLLVDAVATRDGRPIAEVLGGRADDHTGTNQCLFWGSDEVFARLAERYLAEGFRKLKVRIGVAGFERDLARLRLLRALGGNDIEIAVDANGSWDLETARQRLAALEPIGIAYIEQPTQIGDWAALEALARSTTIPIMLDEGLSSDEDAERLMRLGPPFLAHLKIVKLGGPRVVVGLARRFMQAGIAVMIGQMNEGSTATALAACCTIAARPRHAELYGAYGLIDDATAHVSYSAGQIVLARGRDLGADFRLDRCRLLWELRSGT